MSSLSTDRTPRERLARLVTLLSRTRIFWKSAAAIAGIGLMVSFVAALRAKRAWRSETTVLYQDAIKTSRDGESASSRASRLGPKLKDLLYARPALAEVITEFALFPEKTAKSMVEAEEEVQGALSFRARASDTFVISFVYEDPDVAQQVAARLAANMIRDYHRENLAGATLTRDFLHNKRDEASARVEEASRALASFLAQHPQFQWGANDSPYAPTPSTSGASPRVPGEGALPRLDTRDPLVASLERELARVESLLAPPPAGPAQVAASQAEAQKRRDAAAVSLAAAQQTLADKLATLTPAHPDAQAAQGKVEVARQALASADAALRVAKAGTPLPPEPPPTMSAEERSRLEKKRQSLQAQIYDRRRAALPPKNEKPERAPKAGEPKVAPAPDTVDLETEWHKLKFALENARNELHGVEVAAQAADISADAMERKSKAEMTILEPAFRPTRPDRGKGRVFLGGAVVSLFLAVAYAATRVLLNDTLLDEADIEGLGGPPLLVSLPVLASVVTPPERPVVPCPSREAVPERDRSGASIPPRPPIVVAPVIVTAAAAPPPPPRLPPPPAPRPRRHQATIRFGARVPVDGVSLVEEFAAAPPEAPREERSAPLAVVSTHAIVAMGGPDTPDGPEVEVAYTDVDPDGDGAFALLSTAPPSVLAALRVLRHRLDQRRAGEPFVVSVVSPGGAEGKTLLAARLAMTLSESDRARVVLVEGNLQRPNVAASLGIKLEERAALSRQVHQRMLGNAVPWALVKLGPSLAVIGEPGEAAFPGVVHSTQYQELLRALKRRYDYVVVDGPSVLGSGDANVLEEASDGVIVVARAAATRGAALARAEQQLGARRLLGVVLNGVAEPREGLAREPRLRATSSA